MHPVIVRERLRWNHKGMANRQPTYQQPPKFVDINGITIPTRRISMAIYLVEEIEAFAQERHAQHLADGTAPIIEAVPKSKKQKSKKGATGSHKPNKPQA